MTKIINSVLVANRGEIARRVIKTAKSAGIKTMAVYSDIDKNALFVKEADASEPLGGSKPQESYLDYEKVVSIAVKNKCDAIHPGYGFLSENRVFVAECKKNNIVFIGPDEEAIESMGDKARARETVEKMGIPTIPGSGILKEVEDAKVFCKKVSFPVLLKASAGGGGIGMKKVENEKDLESSFQETTDRAGFAFSDNRVYIEKYLEEPHHIEIQVFRDSSGNILTFKERECSVQRRYQKVVEESPSTFVTEELRKNLREAAATLVDGIRYLNAGTIEFIVDKNRNFYFLEANTRLQVEHPVTEEITGLDLVRLQFIIASGNKIPFKESEITFNGHAIESRIYAEDPVRFFPSPGTISEYKEPTGEGVRVDSGYGEKGVVSQFYDPLVAKLITSGENREKAIERMVKALGEYNIKGIKTNIDFLKKVFTAPLFLNGGYDTHFIEKMKS